MTGRTIRFRYVETRLVDGDNYQGTGTGLMWVEGGKLHVVDKGGDELAYDRFATTSRMRKVGAAALKDCNRLLTLS